MLLLFRVQRVLSVVKLLAFLCRVANGRKDGEGEEEREGKGKEGGGRWHGES